MIETGAESLPTSVLFYLFADRLAIPPAAMGERRQTGVVPCKHESALHTVPLIGLLLATACWDLQERGVARLELQQVLWGRSIRIRLEGSWLVEHLQPFSLDALLRATDEIPRLPGLEGEILAGLYRSTLGHGRLTGALARRQLETMEPRRREELERRLAKAATEGTVGEDSRGLRLNSLLSSVVTGSGAVRPDLQAIEQLQQAIAGLGYAVDTTVEGSGFLGLGASKTVHTLDCEKVAALQGEFERRLARWSMFRTDEQRLAGELVSQCVTKVRHAKSGFDSAF